MANSIVAVFLFVPSKRIALKGNVPPAVETQRRLS
jgi:hypothetical protein